MTPFIKEQPRSRCALRARAFGAVVVGVSAGGFEALSTLLPALPAQFPLPLLIVQHRMTGSDDFMVQSLNRISAITVKEAEEKERPRGGCAYIAPADYHLLVERDETLSLSVDARENYSRPSIDVLFESAAYAWSDRLIGLILTGANSDGARGLELIGQRGGVTMVQDPETAEHDTMPRAAMAAAPIDYSLAIPEIAALLATLHPSAEV